MIPCFGYLRVSGLTPRQESAIRSWAALNGYEIVKLFTDGGVSGKTDLVHGYAAPQWAFSWETIAYCLNEGTVLRG